MHIGNLNPFRYRGYYCDTESGLYYLQSRYYVPFLRRFFSADSEEIVAYALDDIADKNLFSYCYNNPINRIDALGNRWEYAYAGGSSTYLENDNENDPTVLGIPGTMVAIAATWYYTNIKTGKSISSSKTDPDPYSRPGQKKQGRERKEKKKSDNKRWRNNPNKKPAPPKKHTPGKDHRKITRR